MRWTSEALAAIPFILAALPPGGCAWLRRRCTSRELVSLDPHRQARPDQDQDQRLRELRLYSKGGKERTARFPTELYKRILQAFPRGTLAAATKRIKAVFMMLGHSDEATTLRRYAHDAFSDGELFGDVKCHGRNAETSPRPATRGACVFQGTQSHGELPS